jgi:hypothetical protein
MLLSSLTRYLQPSAIMLSISLGLGLTLLLSNRVLAQTEELSSAKLIFEAHPLPTTAADPAFVTATDVKSSATVDAVATNPVEAQEKQQALLDTVLSTNGETGPESIQAFRAFADWNLKEFLNSSSIAGSIPSMDNARFANIRNTSPNGGSGAEVTAANNSGNPFQSTFYNLYLAKNNYLKALTALVQQPDYSNPDLLVLERLFQKTLFLSTHRENIVYEPDFYMSRRASATGTRLDTSTQELLNSPDYDQGLVSFQRVLDYIDKNKARTAQQIAGTLLEEADWDLLFARVPQSAEKYDSAYQFFESSPVVKERAQALIAPATPVVLPAFMPAPNSRERLGLAADAPIAYFGYYDVSFSIQKNGRTRGIKVLGQGGNVTEAMETRLREYLGKLTFRPRYLAGKLDTEAHSVRYYVGY